MSKYSNGYQAAEHNSTSATKNVNSLELHSKIILAFLFHSRRFISRKTAEINYFNFQFSSTIAWMQWENCKLRKNFE